MEAITKEFIARSRARNPFLNLIYDSTSEVLESSKRIYEDLDKSNAEKEQYFLGRVKANENILDAYGLALIYGEHNDCRVDFQNTLAYSLLCQAYKEDVNSNFWFIRGKISAFDGAFEALKFASMIEAAPFLTKEVAASFSPIEIEDYGSVVLCSPKERREIKMVIDEELVFSKFDTSISNLREDFLKEPSHTDYMFGVIEGLGRVLDITDRVLKNERKIVRPWVIYGFGAKEEMARLQETSLLPTLEKALADNIDCIELGDVIYSESYQEGLLTGFKMALSKLLFYEDIYSDPEEGDKTDR